jgi:hypothetical protein
MANITVTTIVDTIDDTNGVTSLREGLGRWIRHNKRVVRHAQSAGVRHG